MSGAGHLLFHFFLSFITVEIGDRRSVTTRGGIISKGRCPVSSIGKPWLGICLCKLQSQEGHPPPWMAGIKVKVVIYSQTQSPSALSVGDLEGLFKDLLHCCALCSILDSSSNACASKVTKANELSCSIQPLNTLHITSKDTKISPGG